MTDLADPYLDIELFVESQWRAISNARLTDREVEALGDEVAVQEAHLAQVRDPSHLRVEKVVRVVHDVLQLLRFVFKLTGANANQALIRALYGATEPLVRPFQGIFPEPQGPPVLDIAALLSIGFMFLVALLIVALVRAITAPKSV